MSGSAQVYQSWPIPGGRIGVGVERDHPLTATEMAALEPLMAAAAEYARAFDPPATEGERP